MPRHPWFRRLPAFTIDLAGLLAKAVAAFLLAARPAAAAAPPALPRPFWEEVPRTHKGLPAKLALTSDGRLLGIMGFCDDQNCLMAWVWDTATRKLVFQTPPRMIGGSWWGMAFLPGGKSMVLVTARQPRAEVRVIDIPSGYLRKEFTLSRTVGRVSAVSPNGKKLVVSGDNMVFSVYDLTTGWQIDELTGPEPQPITNFPLLTENGDEYQARSDNRVSRLEFSPDGKYVAVGTNGGWTSVWDLGQRTRLWRKRFAHKQVSGLSFSPDGKTLASVANALTLFRVSDGAGEPLAKEGIGGVWVSFLADGKTLILWNAYTRIGFMGWDSSERRILGESWKASYDRRKPGPRVPGAMQAVVSADRSVMVVERDGPIVELWDLRNMWPR